jgi:hypothetical protein
VQLAGSVEDLRERIPNTAEDMRHKVGFRYSRLPRSQSSLLVLFVHCLLALLILVTEVASRIGAL